MDFKTFSLIVFIVACVLLSGYLLLMRGVIYELTRKLRVYEMTEEMAAIGLDLDTELCHTDVAPYFKRGDECWVSFNESTGMYMVETESVLAILSEEDYQKGFGE